MEEHEWLADRFEAHRAHLRAVAYRMLGSLSDADDAVQEAWLRLSRSGASGVENLGGWLTTVVARVCLDMLRSRQSRREEPLSAHVSESFASREDGRSAARRPWLRGRSPTRVGGSEERARGASNRRSHSWTEPWESSWRRGDGCPGPSPSRSGAGRSSQST